MSPESKHQNSYGWQIEIYFTKLKFPKIFVFIVVKKIFGKGLFITVFLESFFNNPITACYTIV